ncbi:hypothetical protein VitviT2T_027943 [Vitis vinifera]|uniref:Uncharacterized protein n=2 Tax=Vitis vinifera TaxID=29760 RepID=A5C223_VITVI|nr:hypothetical protein VitviT2T_027943 [Vitis vinifera]CAN66279.1 hypothetical protein VITISV_036183 [Vitis vinifera]
MKRKSCSPCDSLVSLFDDDELEVSEILFQIPCIIFQFENRNRLLVAWGVRKRRSAIDPDLYPSSVPSSSSPHLPGTCVVRLVTVMILKRRLSLPALPRLSTSPPANLMASLSALRRVFHLKRKKIYIRHLCDYFSCCPEEEKLLKMVEDLTHQKKLLKTEIENVERFYNPLKALNSELKAKKQQLNLDTVIAEARVESREQAHPQQPLPLLLHDSAPTSALVANPMDPRVIPGLNVSPEETLGPELVAPLDLNLSIALNADTTQLNRVAATQARKKRLQIYRVKKPKAPPHTNQFLKLSVSVTNV